jgi:hypothetical protein
MLVRHLSREQKSQPPERELAVDSLGRVYSNSPASASVQTTTSGDVSVWYSCTSQKWRIMAFSEKAGNYSMDLPIYGFSPIPIHCAPNRVAASSPPSIAPKGGTDAEFDELFRGEQEEAKSQSAVMFMPLDLNKLFEILLPSRSGANGVHVSWS